MEASDGGLSPEAAFASLSEKHRPITQSIIQSMHSLRHLLSYDSHSAKSPPPAAPPHGWPGPCLLEASRPQLFELAHQRRIGPDPSSGDFSHGSAQLLPLFHPKGVRWGNLHFPGTSRPL